MGSKLLDLGLNCLKHIWADLGSKAFVFGFGFGVGVVVAFDVVVGSF